MTKQRTLYTALFALLMIVPVMFIFTACGDKEISSLRVTYDNSIGAVVSGNTTSVTKNYGDAAGLKNFKLEIVYSDKSTETLNAKDKCKSVSFAEPNENPTSTTYSDFSTKLNNNTLDIGTWEVKFEHEEFEATLQITINALTSSDGYNIAITNNVPGLNTPENTLYYATKEAGYNVALTRGSTPVDASNIEAYYRLADDATFDANKSASEYNNEEKLNYITSFETLDPGQYYVCALIAANGAYSAEFSNFTLLTIKKPVFEFDSTDFTLSYTFSTFGEYKDSDVTIADIFEANNYIEGGNLILNSDGDATNNSVTDASDKLTNEEITSNFNSYGEFVPVNASAVYNYANNGDKVLFKFVPVANYADFYAESAQILVTLNITQGEISSPYLGMQFGSEDQNAKVGLQENIFDLRYYTHESDFFTISTNAQQHFNESDTEQNDTFTTTNAGNYYAQFTLNNQNYKWSTTTPDLRDSACSVKYTPASGTTNATLRYTWTVDKVTPDELYPSYLINDASKSWVGGEIMFEDDGKVLFCIGAPDDTVFNGLDITWEVLPVGTDFDDAGITTNITGTLSESEGFNGNPRYRTLTITTSITDFNITFNLGIRISSQGNANFNAFELTYPIQISQIPVEPNVGDNKVFKNYLYEYKDINDNTCTAAFDYYQFENGETYASVLEKLVGRGFGEGKGTWSVIKDKTEDPVSSDTPIANGDVMKFVFTPNVYYYENVIVTVYMLDHAPTNDDFTL